MKKILLAISLLLTVACSKSNDVEEYTIYGENNGGVSFSSLKEDLKINTHTYIWDATNKDFDASMVTRSEILGGYMYDINTEAKIKTDLVYLDQSAFYELLPAGSYFVYTITTADEIPKYTSSHKYFTVTYKEDIRLKKVFTKDDNGLTVYEW